MGILPGQRVWQQHATESTLEITLVHLAYSYEMCGQRWLDTSREPGDAILLAFAFTYHNLIGGKVNILDA